jgi:hypothetical protein
MDRQRSDGTLSVNYLSTRQSWPPFPWVPPLLSLPWSSSPRGHLSLRLGGGGGGGGGGESRPVPLPLSSKARSLNSDDAFKFGSIRKPLALCTTGEAAVRNTLAFSTDPLACEAARVAKTEIARHKDLVRIFVHFRAQYNSALCLFNR